MFWDCCWRMLGFRTSLHVLSYGYGCGCSSSAVLHFPLSGHWSSFLIIQWWYLSALVLALLAPFIWSPPPWSSSDAPSWTKYHLTLSHADCIPVYSCDAISSALSFLSPPYANDPPIYRSHSKGWGYSNAGINFHSWGLQPQEEGLASSWIISSVCPLACIHVRGLCSSFRGFIGKRWTWLACLGLLISIGLWFLGVGTCWCSCDEKLGSEVGSVFRILLAQWLLFCLAILVVDFPCIF